MAVSGAAERHSREKQLVAIQLGEAGFGRTDPIGYQAMFDVVLDLVVNDRVPPAVRQVTGGGSPRLLRCPVEPA